MRRRLGLRAAVAVVAAVAVFTPSSAFATVSLRTTAVSCSASASTPAPLSATKQLTGSANIQCTATTTTTVTVTVQVVELDGTKIDTMGNAFIVSETKTLTKLNGTVSWTVTTPAKTCVNADGTGLEDYYTVVRVTNGKTSATERVGRIDAWNC